LASGSAPLLEKDFAQIKNHFGKEPIEREGMTETGMNFSNPLKGKRKPGSIGLPMPGVQVRLVDPNTGKDANPGQAGEIWLKSLAVTQGYWQKPAATDRAFASGWFKSGDLGHMDTDGYYYLTDRLKHIIISGGENISPKEVEITINQMEGVRESAVVGLTDEKWGEKVGAAVVRKPGAEMSAADIISYCKRQLHAWKCPKEVVFLKVLPRNAMGKIQVDEVRKIFRNEK
jgi:malonyl-CoA/methylmalonyl-CoA synthetase